MAQEPAAWPFVTASLLTDNQAVVSIDGAVYPITENSLEETKKAVIRLIAQTAARLGRPLSVTTHEPNGDWPLVVNPDGSVGPGEADSEPAKAPATPAPVAASPAPKAEQSTAAVRNPAPAWVAPTVEASEPDQTTDQATNAPQPQRVPQPRRAAGPVFMSPVVEPPAKHGVRGTLNTLGLRLAPSATERSIREDSAAIASFGHAGHCILVANPKGGSNKTPTTAMIAAVTARLLGLGVVAVDFNESDGTLGWRTSPMRGVDGPSLVDVLPHIEELLTSGAHAGSLSQWFHHHDEDRYDVLWADQRTASDHLLSGEEVDALYSLMVHYYTTVVIDTGNNVRAENWAAAFNHADALVIPITGAEDSATDAERFLSRMYEKGGHEQDLARNAIAIISQSTAEKDEATRVKQIAAQFQGSATEAPLVADVVTIPYDPALRAGYIRFDALRIPTQNAWIHAVSTIARRFADPF